MTLVTPIDHSHASLSMVFPSKYTGMGCHFLLQGIFLTQGLNQCLLLSPYIYIYIYMVTKKVKNLLANSGKKTKTKTKTINLAYTCIPNTIFCCLRQSIWFSSPSGCHFLLPHWKPAFAKAYVTTDLHRQNPLCGVVSTAMGELRAGFIDSAPSTVRGSPLPHLE